MQFGANFSSFLLPPALVAVTASTLLYQTAPRGAGQRLDPLPKHTWSTAAWTSGRLGPQARQAASLDKGLLIQP